MEMIKGMYENDCLKIAMAGHIDSGNAQEAEMEIKKLCEEYPTNQIVLDAEELKYISSAGLRVVLRLRKKAPDLKIINVVPEVYEVLDMTGFTEMITVEKAYRRLSVDGCEVIGQGANGKVYRLDPDTIIKVYFNPDSLPDIHRERELARKAFVLGIPTAIPYDVVRVGEGYGSVFELLNATSFSKLIAAHPEDLDHYIELYVELLKQIHGTEVKPEDMPDMREVALGWARFTQEYLPEEQGKKLVDLVEAVPKRMTMIHGDYHTKNIMMQNGETLLIDMDTLAFGHPVFELASMYLAYVGFAEQDHSVIPSFLGIPYEAAGEIWKKSLRLYLETDDEAVIREVEEKSMIVGYTRLMRRTIRRNGFETEEGRSRIELCKQHLMELLDRVDSLDF